MDKSKTKATTRYPILSRKISPVEITIPTTNATRRYCFVLDKWFGELIEKGFENIYSTYLNNLYKRGKMVKLKKDNKIFEAMIKGVSPTGTLIIQHGIQQEFVFGEVEWII